MSRVFTGSLQVVCDCTHRFRKIISSVNEPKSDDPGTNHGTHFLYIFRNGCVKEGLLFQRLLIVSVKINGKSVCKSVSSDLYERAAVVVYSGFQHYWAILEAVASGADKSAGDCMAQSSTIPQSSSPASCSLTVQDVFYVTSPS